MYVRGILCLYLYTCNISYGFFLARNCQGPDDWYGAKNTSKTLLHTNEYAICMHSVGEAYVVFFCVCFFLRVCNTTPCFLGMTTT